MLAAGACKHNQMVHCTGADALAPVRTGAWGGVGSWVDAWARVCEWARRRVGMIACWRDGVLARWYVGALVCWRVACRRVDVWARWAHWHVRMFMCLHVSTSARWHQHSGLWHNWRDLITYGKFLGVLKGEFVLCTVLDAV